MKRRNRFHAGCVAVACLTLLLTGCRTKSLQTDYGGSTGYAGRESINGFGALRTLYEDVGWRTRSIMRLNERARRLDAIIWIPDTPTGIQKDVTDWAEEWMQPGGKTLIYVTYDGVNDAAYWRQAAKHATPEQRLEYRRRLARAQFDAFTSHLHLNVPESNGWVQWERRANPSAVRAEDLRSARDVPLAKPADDDSAHDDLAPASLDLDAPLSVRVNITQWRASSSSNGNSQAGGATAQPAAQPFPWLTPLHTVDQRSETDVQVRSTVSSKPGIPLITEVTSSKWGDSKVIVVAGGSLINNFALTTESGRLLASHLVADSGEAAQIGFLHTSAAPLGVDESDGSTEARDGMELLVVWPISLITVHGALLGIVIVLVLMPVFGRPRRVKRPTQTDFADHLNAVAAWMERAPDDRYARQKISEYMRRVRGESSGKWVLPEHTDEPPGSDRLPPR